VPTPDLVLRTDLYPFAHLLQIVNLPRSENDGWVKTWKWCDVIVALSYGVENCGAEYDGERPTGAWLNFEADT